MPRSPVRKTLDRPRCPLVVIAGTGTEIGKTHVATALLRAWGESARVIGYKPIETGAEPGKEGADAKALREASTFHVERSVARAAFRDPVSPHLAARREGRTIELETLLVETHALCAQAEGVLVELAGGLFTPLGPNLFNADLARALDPDAVVLVAPDRLGVLHDIAATWRAAAQARLPLRGVVLSAPLLSDPSTGTNASELKTILGLTVLAIFPRTPGEDPATRLAARTLLTELRLT